MPRVGATSQVSSNAHAGFLLGLGLLLGVIANGEDSGRQWHKSMAHSGHLMAFGGCKGDRIMMDDVGYLGHDVIFGGKGDHLMNTC